MNGRDFSKLLGVSEATVSRLMSGDRRPSISLMMKIKDVLGGRLWTLDQQAKALESGKYGEELATRIAKKRLNNAGQR